MKHTVDVDALPTLPQLYGASAVALLVGAVITVTTVLPAEWAIDPTGVGEVLGLTGMGRLKQSLDASAPADQTFAERSDSISVILKPNQGTEVKCVMRAGGVLEYRWSTSGPAVFFDFHGEPKGAAPDVFTSFEKDTKATVEGTFEAPFEGTHGWYWKNKSEEPVTVTLETRGEYHTFGQR